MSLSLYFLPAANRAFKDLQFEIRNRFVSSLIQEGTFTTISDKLTFYIRNRDEHGEVVGLLINDNRDPHAPGHDSRRAGRLRRHAGRLAHRHGQRQPAAIRPARRDKLSVLTFDRYTLDLDALHDAPGVRFREPQERLSERAAVSACRHGPRLASRLCDRGASANRRAALGVQPGADTAGLPAAGRVQPPRTAASAFSWRSAWRFLFELIGVGANDLAARFPAAIPLLYVADLLPLLIGAGIWRKAASGSAVGCRPSRPVAGAEDGDREPLPVQLARTLSAYIARQFFAVVLRRFRGDGRSSPFCSTISS